MLGNDSGSVYREAGKVLLLDYAVPSMHDQRQAKSFDVRQQSLLGSLDLGLELYAFPSDLRDSRGLGLSSTFGKGSLGSRSDRRIDGVNVSVIIEAPRLGRNFGEVTKKVVDRSGIIKLARVILGHRRRRHVYLTSRYL